MKSGPVFIETPSIDIIQLIKYGVLPSNNCIFTQVYLVLQANID